jgi:hypothetical protein
MVFFWSFAALSVIWNALFDIKLPLLQRRDADRPLLRRHFSFLHKSRRVIYQKGGNEK